MQDSKSIPSLEEMQLQKFAISEQAIEALEEFHAAFKKKRIPASLSCRRNRQFTQSMRDAQESLDIIKKEEPKVFEKIRALAAKIETTKNSPESDEFKNLLQKREAAVEYIKHYPTYLSGKSQELAVIFNKLKNPVSLNNQELQEFDDLMAKARSTITEYGDSAVDLWHNQIKSPEATFDAIPEQHRWHKERPKVEEKYYFPTPQKRPAAKSPAAKTPSTIETEPPVTPSLSSKVCFFGAVAISAGVIAASYAFSRRA